MSAAIRGLIIYSNLAIYATDAESKLYCMYDNYSTFANILVFAGLGLLSLLFGAILITARVSPVACITLSIAFGRITTTIGGTSFMRQTMVAPALNQLRIAKGILTAAKCTSVQTATPVEEIQVLAGRD